MENPREVCILAAVRTPLGSILGSLSSMSATELGAIAVRGTFTE
jgi:acetyl-CoA C-acetyltransferase